MLKDNTFWGLKDKVKIAIERLQHRCPGEGYWIGNSGGKDSSTIIALADMSKVKYDAHFNLTTIDPPEVVRFVKEYHPKTQLEIPKLPFVKALVYHGFPMVKSRWCCEEYKEIGGMDRFVVTGIRWEESYRRSKRAMVESCHKKSANKKFIHPIIDWTSQDVWEFIRLYSIQYCKLYDEVWKRIGCCMCPCASPRQRILESKLYPGYTKRFIQAFEEMWQDRKNKNSDSVDRWKNGKEMFDWWLTTNPVPKSKQQQNIVFE